MPRSIDSEIVKRYQGCLVGAAVGDALGAPAEFHSTAEIYQKYNGPLREMVGGGYFKWDIGQTTDDTDMSMGIVNSVVHKGKYDPTDIASNFVDWLYSKPRDIGGTTASGLKFIAEGGDYREAGKKNLLRLNTAPNGSIMRTAPIGLIFRGNNEKMAQASDEVSAMTHAHPECLLACRMTNTLVADLAAGASKQQALDNLYSSFASNRFATGMIEDALKGNYYRHVYQNVGGGYVFESFNIALDAFIKHNNFEDAVVYAVNLGGDADSQATVAGAFAGAHYGIDAIPDRWKQPLNPFTADEIAEKAKKIYLINRQISKTEPSGWLQRFRQYIS